jgi:hypothetical protein
MRRCSTRAISPSPAFCAARVTTSLTCVQRAGVKLSYSVIVRGAAMTARFLRPCGRPREHRKRRLVTIDALRAWLLSHEVLP